MKVAFCAGEHRARNRHLGKALEEGLHKHGDELIFYNSQEQKCNPTEDVRIIHGVTDTKQKQSMDGIHRFVFDKGYNRTTIRGANEWVYWSIRYMPSWPETRLLINAPHDRLRTIRKTIPKPRKSIYQNTKITLALSSQKYCDHHRLGNATKYAKSIISKMKTKRHIIYRPKPSFAGAVRIKGARFDYGMMRGKSIGLRRTLDRTHVLVTHGSGVALNAIIAGIPAITLGGGIAYGVSGHSLKNLEDPFWPDAKHRLNWLADVGYSHFTLDEMRSGLAWEVMKISLQ
jgi:hypothetical protein